MTSEVSNASSRVQGNLSSLYATKMPAKAPSPRYITWHTQVNWVDSQDSAHVRRCLICRSACCLQCFAWWETSLIPRCDPKNCGERGIDLLTVDLNFGDRSNTTLAVLMRLKRVGRAGMYGGVVLGVRLRGPLGTSYPWLTGEINVDPGPFAVSRTLPQALYYSAFEQRPWPRSLRLVKLNDSSRPGGWRQGFDLGTTS